ncbi:hypothetical protein, partial [Paraburkholderia caribensis]|uniref:hypothetical protein n=1 Tax=Paraburkholderia caribensis TaxID=75105 RepID=UPI003F555895
ATREARRQIADASENTSKPHRPRHEGKSRMPAQTQANPTGHGTKANHGCQRKHKQTPPATPRRQITDASAKNKPPTTPNTDAHAKLTTTQSAAGKQPNQNPKWKSTYP